MEVERCGCLQDSEGLMKDSIELHHGKSRIQGCLDSEGLQFRISDYLNDLLVLI